MSNPEEQYERIKDVYVAIPLDGKVTVLTGSNNSGKSLIRNQMTFRIRDEVEGKRRIFQTSMELRSASQPSLGAFSSFAHDDSWLSTSFQTISSIRKVLALLDGEENPAYLVIDEPELGLGEETQLSVALLLNEELPKHNFLGALIITHSRIMVTHLKFDHFFNLDGIINAEDWLARPMIPTDLAALEENALFHFIKANR